MLLLLQRLGFSHNHHHGRRDHMSETDLASLQAFRSHVSENLHRVLESLKLGSDFLSFKWIHLCFRILPVIHNAFAKLMVEIDYPVSSWEAGSVEEYLDYSINLLDLLNSISSSLSHLNLARVSLSHALSHMESSPSLGIERMREITKHDSLKEFKASRVGDGKSNLNNGKERIFHEAMLIMRSTGFWVCGVVLLGLNTSIRPIMEIMRTEVLVDSTLLALDSIVKKKLTVEGGFIKEAEGVNEAVRLIVLSGNGDSDAAKELKRRLEVVENGSQGLKEAEESLFGKIMAARNEVLDKLRRNHK